WPIGLSLIVGLGFFICWEYCLLGYGFGRDSSKKRIMLKRLRSLRIFSTLSSLSRFLSFLRPSRRTIELARGFCRQFMFRFCWSCLYYSIKFGNRFASVSQNGC